MTVIKSCTCDHEAQDIIYGKGKRVHNLSQDDKKAYCTVCCPSNKRDKRIPGRPMRTAKILK